ncbi:hypothetical protein IGJ55_002991 [Enterococcus sp. AZ170]|uniref:hypothetical protein n=1 Tax=Enterococcus sp. AZ170 TaxID=2774747 RepID=UPI003D2FAAB8
MIFTDDEIRTLIDDSMEAMANTNLAIIYNAIGFTRKINKTHESTDFFSNEEIGEIFDSLILNGINILPYPNELDFIKDIMEKKIDLNRLVVWNLSRQGSNNNQKSLITSLCDFETIPYIGSSVYAMNLARNKFHFQKLLKSESLAFIPTFNIENFLNEIFSETDRFLLKKSNGSASRGILSETTSKSHPELTEYIQNNPISKDLIVQKFIDGYEIEVPLFQINGEFKALGLAGISVKNSKFLYGKTLPEEMFEHSSQYDFFDFSDFAINCINYNSLKYIYQTAIDIANLLELKDYCRVDFRVESGGNIYCFDISTTPYVTHHSSPNFLLKKRGFTHQTLLALVFSAFNSNVGNH